MKYRWEEENLKQIIKDSKNKKEILQKLGLNPHPGNYDTLRRYIIKYDINIDHLKLDHNTNILIKYNFDNKQDIDNILVENSEYSNRTSLKNRLYKEGLKERICEKCGQDEEWNGEHMSLILDHINGINNDNRLENLRILCPNCNATLDTHCGKNKNNTNSNEKYCLCGEKIDKKSKMCRKCYKKNKRTVERPYKNILLDDVKMLGYCGTGRKYGVSDNCIRKWLIEK